MIKNTALHQFKSLLSEGPLAISRVRRQRTILGAALVIAVIAVMLAPSSAQASQPGSAALSGAIFDTGTDPAYAEQVLAELNATQEGLGLAQVGAHWTPSATALNNGGGAQGDSIELTWSIIPDGTFMPSQGGFDTACASNLIATFDAAYGAGVWQDEIQAVWDDWTANTGNVYTPAVTPDADGTPIDDGAGWPFSDGLANVRGDVRIGGCTIDGNSGVLAYNFFPDIGDMKLDAPDSFYSSNPVVPELHNVLSHEHGHGTGLNHVCPVDGTKLMEPFINTSFVGLQHDDLRGSQRGYGDRFEVINNPNDSQAAATNLGALGNQTETTLSLDSTGDTDWFEFTATAGDSLNVSVTPVGLTYPEGADPFSDGCASASTSPLNSLALQDLSFEVRDSGGVLTTVDATGAGGTEALANFPIAATGTHYVRVLGTGTDDSQLYDLFVGDTAVGTPTPIGNRVWDDTNGNGRQNGGEPGVAGVTVEILDTGGSVVDSTVTSASGLWTATVDSATDWQVRITAPAGQIFTLQNAGSGENGDSDADAAGIIDIPAGTLNPGVNNYYLDAGLVPGSGGTPTPIGNRVWDDTNGNGRQNGGEPGVAGVTVEILDTGGSVVDSTVTNSTGKWSATVDSATDWQVRITAPAGQVFTLQNAGSGENGDSDADAAGIIDIPAGTLNPGVTNYYFDAGLVPAGGGPVAPIGNRVWDDTNGNGRQNSGEPGVAGVTVEILDPGGSVVDSTVTNSTGKWSATVDTALAWQVRIVAPAGWFFTIQDAGTGDHGDSDADAGGIIDLPAGTLNPGVNNFTWDAGIIPEVG